MRDSFYNTDSSSSMLTPVLLSYAAGRATLTRRTSSDNGIGSPSAARISSASSMASRAFARAGTSAA